MVRTANKQLITVFKLENPFHCASIAPMAFTYKSMGILIQEIVQRNSRSVSGGFAFLMFVIKIAEKVNGFIQAFSGVVSNWYWSSTTYVNNTNNAWIVNLNNGNVNNDNKGNNNYVWPVRGGK
jgi:hypothetical protein